MDITLPQSDLNTVSNAKSTISSRIDGIFKTTRLPHRNRNPTRPKFLELRSSKWFITLVVSFASATDVFVYGLIVPVTPTALKTRVGIPEESVQKWTSILLALFGVALLASSPIAGYIADRSESRRWPYLSALVGLGAGTVLLCVAKSIGFWIAGRLFQGAASAVVWVVGNALVADTVGKDQVGEAVGYTTMACSVGLLSGPLLGGVVYEHGGYYAVFGLALGLIGLDIVLRLSLIEKRRAIRWLRLGEDHIDTNQEATKQHGMEKAAAGGPEGAVKPGNCSQDQVIPHGAPSVSVFGRVGILLNSPRIITAIWGSFVVSIMISSFDSVLPLFVQETFGWKQTGQGLIFIPLIVPHTLSPVAGSIMDKYPELCRYITGGAFLSSVPTLVLLRLVTDNSIGHKVLLCALLTPIGVCIAIAMPAFFGEALRVVGDMEHQAPHIFGKGGAVALAFGLVNIGFASGSIAGPFFAGFIRQQASWGTMGWALGLVTGVSSLPILAFMGGRIWRSS